MLRTKALMDTAYYDDDPADEGDECEIRSRSYASVNHRNSRARSAREAHGRISEILNPTQYDNSVMWAREPGHSVAGIEVEGREINSKVDLADPRAARVTFDVVEGEVQRVLVERGGEIGQGREIDFDEFLVRCIHISQVSGRWSARHRRFLIHFADDGVVEGLGPSTGRRDQGDSECEDDCVAWLCHSVISVFRR